MMDTDASFDPTTPFDAPAAPSDSTRDHQELSLSGTLHASSVELQEAASHRSPSSLDSADESTTAAAHVHPHTLAEVRPIVNPASMDIMTQRESQASPSVDAMDVDAVGEEAAAASLPVPILLPATITVLPPVEGDQPEAAATTELDTDERLPPVTIEEEYPTHSEEEEGDSEADRRQEKVLAPIQPAPSENHLIVPIQPVPLGLPVTQSVSTENALPGASIDSDASEPAISFSAPQPQRITMLAAGQTGATIDHTSESPIGDTDEPMADVAHSRATSVSLESEGSSAASDFGSSRDDAAYRSLLPHLSLGLPAQLSHDGDPQISAIVSFLRRSSRFMVLSHAKANIDILSDEFKWLGRGSAGLAGTDPSRHTLAPPLPLSLAWLVDDTTQQVRAKRSDISDEAKKRFPLLPHWTWSLPDHLTDRESLLVACVVSAYPEILRWDESSAEPDLQSQQDLLLRRVLHLMRAIDSALLSRGSCASRLTGTLDVSEEDSIDQLGCKLVFRFVQWDSAHMRDAALHEPRRYHSVLCNDSERLSGMMIDLSPVVMPPGRPVKDPVERHVRVLQFHSRADDVKDVTQALDNSKPAASQWIRYQPILPAPPMLSMGPNWPGFRGDPTLWLPLRSAGTDLPTLYAVPFFHDAQGHTAVRMGSVMRFRESPEESMFFGVVMACVVKISVSLRDDTLSHPSFSELQAEHDRAAIREHVQGGTATRFLVLRLRDEQTIRMAQDEGNVHSIDHAELLRAIGCDQNTVEFVCETRCVALQSGRYIDVSNESDDSTLAADLSNSGEPILSDVVVNEWSSSKPRGGKGNPVTPSFHSQKEEHNVMDFFMIDRALGRWWPQGIAVLERNEQPQVNGDVAMLAQATQREFCRRIADAADPGSAWFDVDTQVRWFGCFVGAIPTTAAGVPKRSVVFPWPPPVQKPKGNGAVHKKSPAKRHASRSQSTSPERLVTRRGPGKASSAVKPESASGSSDEAQTGRVTRGKANKQQTPNSQLASRETPSTAAIAATRTAEKAAAIKEVCISLVLELSDPRDGVDLAIAPLRCAMQQFVPNPKKGAPMSVLDRSIKLWERIETLDPLLAEHLRVVAQSILGKKQTKILREVLDPIVEGLAKQDWRIPKGASGKLKSVGKNLLWMTASKPGSRPKPMTLQIESSLDQVDQQRLQTQLLEAELKAAEVEKNQLKAAAAAATAAAAAAAIAAVKQRPPVQPAKPVPAAAAAAGSPTRTQLTREERAVQREKEKMELEKLKQEQLLQLQSTAKKVTIKSVALDTSSRKPVAGQKKRKRLDDPSESPTEEKTPPNEESTPVPTVQQSPPSVSHESIAAAAAAATASAIQPFQAELSNMRATLQALLPILAERQAVAQVNTSAQPPSTPSAVGVASSPMVSPPHPAAAAGVGTVDSPQLKFHPHETIPDVTVNHHKSTRTQVGQSPATGSRTYHQNQPGPPHDHSHQPQPYHHQSPPIRPNPVQGVPTQSQPILPAHHHPQRRVSPSVQQQLQPRFESTADLMNQMDDYDGQASGIIDIDTSQALHGTGVQRLQDDLQRSAFEALLEQQQRQIQARHHPHQQQQLQQQLLHHLLASTAGFSSHSARSSHGTGGDDLLRLLPPNSSAHQPFAPSLNPYAPTSFIGHPVPPSTLNSDQLRMQLEAIVDNMRSSNQQPAYGSIYDERRIEFPGMHSRKGRR